MTFLLFWALAVIGFTQIVCVSLLFKPFREWSRWPELLKSLWKCPLCCGVWLGLGLSLTGFGPGSEFVRYPWVFDSMACAAVCWIAHIVLVALGSKKL